jgi:hypothetical protein
MFDADTSLSPTISDDDDLLSPWDDTDDAPIPIVEPDEEDDLIVPKPIKPLDEDEIEDDDGDIGLLLDDDLEDTL